MQKDNLGAKFFKLAELLGDFAKFWEIIGRGSFKNFDNPAVNPGAGVSAPYSGQRELSGATKRM